MAHYQIPLRVITFLIGITGITANSLSLSYFYKRQKKGLGNKLLILLNSFDLFVCGTSLATSISFQFCLLNQCIAGKSMLKTVYLTSGFLYGVSYDCTGFATCLIAVTRTIKVCRPFYSIKGLWVTVSFLSYLLCSCTREFTLYYFSFIHSTENLDTFKSYYAILYPMGTLLSVIAVGISTGITSHWLLRKNEPEPRMEGSSGNRYATITVLILSVAFFAVNAFMISGAIIQFCTKFYLIEENEFLTAYRDIVFSLTMILSSTVNPIIYLTRKREMRQFVYDIRRTVKERLSRSDPVVNVTCSDVTPRAMTSHRGVNVVELTMRREDSNTAENEEKKP